MDPDLMQLRYLVALDQERNFTRAAARCHVTQQSLSAGIARLEQLIGVSLVQRSTRSVTLTEAGELLAERAARALTDLRAAVADAQTMATGHAGRLTIGFHGPGAEVISSTLARYTAQYPDVHVELRRADFTDPTAGLLSHQADIAVIAAPLQHPQLASIPLATELLVFALPVDHRLAGRSSLRLDDLDGEPIAEMANPTGDELLSQWNHYWTLSKHRPAQPTAPASFTGVEEWLAGQRTAPYITTGPASAADLYPARGIVYIPADDLPPVTWRLYYNPDRLTAQAAACLRLIDEPPSARAEKPRRGPHRRRRHAG